MFICIFTLDWLIISIFQKKTIGLLVKLSFHSKWKHIQKNHTTIDIKTFFFYFKYHTIEKRYSLASLKFTLILKWWQPRKKLPKILYVSNDDDFVRSIKWKKRRALAHNKNNNSINRIQNETQLVHLVQATTTLGDACVLMFSVWLFFSHYTICIQKIQ